MEPITTITFFKYGGLKNKLWAFGMMQYAHGHLKNVNGLTFYKLMGTGKGNGFNPWPDFSTYAMLQVWENEEAANQFFTDSSLDRKYQEHTIEKWTLFLRTVKADGTWSGLNPFVKSEHLNSEIPFLAIITRATIRKRKLLRFWRYVPTSEKPLKGNSGLMYTKGVGEVPFLQMATFSLWSDKDSLHQFAYGSKEHAKAIRLTRELDWYKEELFSRFQPFKSIGTWSGSNPLPELE